MFLADYRSARMLEKKSTFLAATHPYLQFLSLANPTIFSPKGYSGRSRNAPLADLFPILREIIPGRGKGSQKMELRRGSAGFYTL
jgi:hypothetical protein